MASGQLLVVLMCTALAAAHTINLEKLLISVTDDSKNTEPVVSEILNSLLSDRGNTSSASDFDLRDCTKGKCEFCKKEIIKVCLIATIENAKIKVEITVNGKPFLETEISAPRKVCKDISFIPEVKKVCIAFTDIDLKKMYGCVTVSLQTKLPIPVHFKIGCFTIPHTDEELLNADEMLQDTDAASLQQDTQNEATDMLEPGTVLKFLSLKTEK